MPFARVVGRFHRHADLFQRRFHALGVLHRRTLVFAPRRQQHGHLDPGRQVHRRNLRQCCWLAQPVAQVVHARRAVLHIAALEHQRQVVHAHITGRAAVQRGLAGNPHQRGVRAVAGAVDADAPCIGDAFGDGPARGIGDIVLHGAAPLFRGSLGVRAAMVARAPEVDLQHRIAGRCQQLVVALEAAVVELADGASMRLHHHRQPAAIAAVRNGKEAVQRHAIACGQGHRTHAGTAVAVEPAVARGQERRFAGGRIEQEPVAGIFS